MLRRREQAPEGADVRPRITALGTAPCKTSVASGHARANTRPYPAQRWSLRVLFR